MRREVWSSLVVVCIFAAPVALSAGDAGPQDDAGTGRDASDLRAAPTLLPSYGAYAGSLRSHDEDWFAVAEDTGAGPFCVLANVSGSTYSKVTLGVERAPASRSVTTLLSETMPTVLALASADATSTVLGLVPVPNPANNEPARPGEYAFDLARRTPAQLGPGDGGSGVDAGAVAGESLPAPGACFAGMLSPLMGVGDTRDLYSFSGKGNATIVYSLGSGEGPSVSLTIVDGSGAQLGAPVGSGGVGLVTLPADGVYYAQLSQADATGQLTYTVALIGPPTDPCRPTCSLT